MIGRALGEKAVRRLSRGFPVVELLRAAQVAVLAGEHLGKLDGPERRRLIALMRVGRGRPSRLSESEAAELRALVAKLEPRLFAGAAIDKLSPVPVPKRLLYGKRHAPARAAAER